ncbi:hypothetical protein M422DRAFT_65256 [Sphaerobolus stellatus SS14]|nr:hypothetical protein M422DRAFT_65256 [Sphaerobolus stellatus SS14]
MSNERLLSKNTPPSDPDLLPDFDHRNQGVFLRGYRIGDRKTYALWRIFSRRRSNGFTELDPDDRNNAKRDSGTDGAGSSDMSDSGSSTSGLSSGSHRNGSPSYTHKQTQYSLSDFGLLESELDSFDSSMSLAFDRPLSPFDILLMYILQKSGAEIALAHDDDLEIFTEMINYNATRLENELASLQPQISVVDSVGILKPTRQPTKSNMDSVTNPSQLYPPLISKGTHREAKHREAKHESEEEGNLELNRRGCTNVTHADIQYLLCGHLSPDARIQRACMQDLNVDKRK